MYTLKPGQGRAADHGMTITLGSIGTQYPGSVENVNKKSKCKVQSLLLLLSRDYWKIEDLGGVMSSLLASRGLSRPVVAANLSQLIRGKGLWLAGWHMLIKCTLCSYQFSLSEAKAIYPE